MSSRFVSHDSCPACGSKDNLARYDDGGAFCFGCHYREGRTHRPMRRSEEDDGRRDKPLPDDIGHHYSEACVEWLGRFHVDVPTAIVNGLVWSPKNEQLIYQMGVCWQARNFGGFWLEKFGKCYTSGDVNACLHIYDTGSVDQAEQGNNGSGGTESTVRRSETLVIVEDPVSALRIGSLCPSMPLLGSHLAQARLNAIARLYPRVMFWLDSDKLKEARAMEQRAKYMGLSTRTVYTDEDPKCYTNDQLLEILTL